MAVARVPPHSDFGENRRLLVRVRVLRLAELPPIAERDTEVALPARVLGVRRAARRFRGRTIGEGGVMRLAYYHEPFADVSLRLNLVSRVIAAQEAILDGDTDTAIGYMANLERELVRAIEENHDREFEEAA